MEGQLSKVQVCAVSFIEAMRQETERMLREVMQAVNEAADGAWIDDSEKTVRDLMDEYRRRTFEKALQIKTDTFEGAFSPGRRGERRASGMQGD